ncbi:MAG TPA: T9SS type A sorting domain-containing protein [Bacteroidetes bacterium]|nr:T9SS type A sorting domain-containing protein [Bacteroidota bacterium]
MRLFNTDSLNTDDRLFSFILKLDSSGFYSGFDTLQSIDFVYEKWFNGLKYEKIENAFEIYPNPTKDMIKVTLPEINNWHRWSIYDLTGRLRKNGTVDNKQDFIISGLKDLESGMYFLKVYDDQGKVGIGKFVVE